MSFVCPICAGRSYSYRSYAHNADSSGGTFYVCDGCSVVFMDPWKFDHNNPGEPVPEGSPTSNKFDRNPLSRFQPPGPSTGDPS